MAEATDIDYDPFAEEVLADPFAAYGRLRETCPVHHHPDFGERGFYTLSRYDDVVALSRDVARWSADYGQGPIYVKEGGLRSDPPEHTIYRRLVTSAFTARRVAAMEAEIRELANALVDAFASAGHVDLCEAFAVPLPLIMISQILGVPPERRDEFKAWSDEFMSGQNTADPAVQGRARAKIDDYFRDELGRRRSILAKAGAGGLPDDVLTSLLLAEHDGESFTDDQLLPLLLLLLVGGNETTTSLLASLVYRLLQFDLWDEVAGNDATWDVAIEESLRFDPPVLGLFRTAKGDQRVHDVEIPADAKVQGLYAAANRDGDVWDDPDAFRIDRDVAELRRRHLSFGVGIWLCPGASLARLEARVALEVLGTRLAGLRLAEAPSRIASFMMWGPEHLHVAWDTPS